jgi:hypothetical protein|tara:strand:+ start:267 stop:908 length:642 start_codon:yes stop_codon:yes gene_type:complete
MAQIDFLVNTAGFNYNLNVGGSGIAFFGDSGFGQSVNVGSYQGTTFVSDGSGGTQGAQGKNIKWLNAGSGIIGAASSGVGLRAIPNYQSTLQIRFTHGSAVKTQNAELRIYDRSSINSAAVGVTTKVAEIIHPSELLGPGGSGDRSWITPYGSGVVVNLAGSPGISGLYAGDGVSSISTRSFTRHDWHAAISASPDSIGNKTSYGLYFALEYL